MSFDEFSDATADTQKPVRTNICAKAESVLCLTDLGVVYNNRIFSFVIMISFVAGNPLTVKGVLVASFRNGPIWESVEEKYPNIYTDVSYYTEWIEQQTSMDFEINLFLS